jgi:hypothetical protein
MGSGSGGRCSRGGDVCAGMCIGDQGARGLVYVFKDVHSLWSRMCIVCGQGCA